jgi:hypothetical protein
MNAAVVEFFQLIETRRYEEIMLQLRKDPGLIDAYDVRSFCLLLFAIVIMPNL